MFNQNRTKKSKGSDNESDKEDLVADIFGGSSDEEEFEGFGEADVEATAKKKEKKTGTVCEEMFVGFDSFKAFTVMTTLSLTLLDIV